MSNLCCTEVTFYSTDQKELGRFRFFLDALYNECSQNGILIKINDKARIEHNCTYFIMQDALNIPSEKQVNGRGEIVDIRKIEHDEYGLYHFVVDMDDANEAHPECFQNILDWRFADIGFSYLAIENSNGYAVVHDDIGYYPQRYFVSGEICSCDPKILNGDSLYNIFNSEDECKEFVKELVHQVSGDVISTAGSLAEVESAANKCVEDGDDTINIYDIAFV